MSPSRQVPTRLLGGHHRLPEASRSGPAPTGGLSIVGLVVDGAGSILAACSQVVADNDSRVVTVKVSGAAASPTASPTTWRSLLLGV